MLINVATLYRFILINCLIFMRSSVHVDILNYEVHIYAGDVQVQ